MEALRNINLHVVHGEYVAIIGPSGSGKSTLLNLLGLLDRPTSGTYRFAGVDVSRLRERERSAYRGQLIGFVFQSFHLLDQRSALENVILGALYQPAKGPNRELAQRAQQALASVALSHRLTSPPSRLSGGERQRVAIARALINQPELLLCDEPTGNLDSANTNNVLRLIDQLHTTGQTVLVITHDPTVAAHAQRRVAITDGVLAEVD
ncbi:MAG: ABC transporter ATP-binding protein [Nocardioidaceae bacterium]